MATDLGTYFLIGPSIAVITELLNKIADGLICHYFEINQRELVVGFHSYQSTLLQSKICLLELPGFHDTRFDLTDSQLLCLMQHIYFQALSKGFRAKGFLVAEALLTDRLAIFNSILRLFNVCGNNCKKSVLVLAGIMYQLKEGKVTNNLIPRNCQSLNIPYVKWTNSLNKLSKEEADITLSNLMTALMNMEPYYATWMTELEEEIKNAPVLENRVERNIIVDEDSDNSDNEVDNLGDKLRSAFQIGVSIYYKNLILTRPGVINTSRKAFGLRYDEFLVNSTYNRK